jgi:hypothetical protein
VVARYDGERPLALVHHQLLAQKESLGQLAAELALQVRRFVPELE